jgi:hypothetical protein
MIRYSTYGSTNRRINPSTPIQLLSSLEKEYRELQDLRERVREAEAAAAKRLRAAREVEDLWPSGVEMRARPSRR